MEEEDRDGGLVDIERIDDLDDDGLIRSQPSTSGLNSNRVSLSSSSHSAPFELLTKPSRCQLCGGYSSLHDMQRLPLRREKYMPILRNANVAEEVVNDLDKRLQLRRGIRVCRMHFPVPSTSNNLFVGGLYADKIYPIACKLCGQRKLPTAMRCIPVTRVRRQQFYEYAGVSEADRHKFDTAIMVRPRIALLVCETHLPFEKDSARSRAARTSEYVEDEEGQMRRLKTNNPYEMKKERNRQAGLPAIGIQKSLCHWCSKTGNPREMRKFPDYLPAVEAFFEHNNASDERRVEILHKMKENLRGLKMCYQHFPKEWAHARGRFWYRLYFGTEEEKKKANSRKDSRNKRKLQMETEERVVVEERGKEEEEEVEEESDESEDEKIDVEGEEDREVNRRQRLPSLREVRVAETRQRLPSLQSPFLLPIGSDIQGSSYDPHSSITMGTFMTRGTMVNSIQKQEDVSVQAAHTLCSLGGPTSLHPPSSTYSITDNTQVPNSTFFPQTTVSLPHSYHQTSMW